MDEARKIEGYSYADRMHGYFYGRWPYLYIGVGTGEHRLTKLLLPVFAFFLGRAHRPAQEGNRTAAEQSGPQPSGTEEGPLEPNAAREVVESLGKPMREMIADGYHGKVVRFDAARQLVTLNKDISVKCPEQVIPYPRARDIIMRNPDHIVALDCPCRSVRDNPCKPVDVCLVVGEPFASFIVEHIPDRARRITQDKAAEILREESERGHVHHAFFKDAMLERFYAICNCCSCCCGALQAYEHGTPLLAPSGYVSQISADDCIACESCVEACQFGAISMVDGNGSGEGWAVVDYELCMGCGVCASHCEWEAAALVRDAAKGDPLEIHELIAQSEPEHSARS
jgi:Pyruvate/2-oxoacid:ferredoxin oxidoreductase delta subunit